MAVRGRNGLRALLAGVVAGVFVLGAVAPASSQDAPGTGSSTLALVPGALDVEGLPVPVDTVLGTILVGATNAGTPVSTLSLTGLSAAGDLFPGFDLSSANGPQSGSESHTVGAAGVTATLDLVEWLLQSDADSAVASLSALGADIATPIGLGATLDTQRLASAAVPGQTTSALTFTISALNLDLADLLPAGVLDELPLTVLLDLVNQLGLPLPASVLDGIASLSQLRSTLGAAIDAAADRNAVNDLLDAAIASNPTLAGLRDAVADATAGVTAAQSSVSSIQASIASLQGQLAGLNPILDAAQILQINNQLATLTSSLTAAQSTLSSAQATLAAAQGALDAALADVGSLNATIAGLLDQLADLETLLDTLLGQLNGILGGLDLPGLQLDLLDLVTGAPLLDLGTLTLDLETVADATGGRGTVTCGVSGVSVLGVAVPGATCDSLQTILADLAATIGGLLSTLPVSVPVPTIELAGPTPTASGATPPGADGTTSAVAALQALTVDIAPVGLTAMLDDVLGELDRLVGDLDGLLTELTVPVASVTSGLVGLSAPGSVVGPAAGLIAVPAGLGDALGTLRTTIASLPLGDALDGLSTLGIGAELGTVGLTSTFTPASAGTPGTPGTPVTPGTPATPSAPDTPGSLPTTGSDATRVALAAIAALAAGLVTRGLGRSFDLGLHRARVR